MVVGCLAYFVFESLRNTVLFPIRETLTTINFHVSGENGFIISEF